MIAVLLNIRSSYNVGSIFRTANGAGVEKIYLVGITPASVDKYGRENKKLTKVSLGAEKSVPFERARSGGPLLDRLKKDGFEIIAIEQSKHSKNLFEFRPKKSEKYALVFGGEVKGLAPAMLKKADKILEIPMIGRKESLNVSVAFGIATYNFI